MKFFTKEKRNRHPIIENSDIKNIRNYQFYLIDKISELRKEVRNCELWLREQSSNIINR